MKKIHKNILYSTALVLLLGLSSCHDNNNDESVLSQRYVHKYGYALTKAEWEAKDYPGQVITMHNDGVTVTTTYEAGMLHGPHTITYPHSQTIEHYTLYNQGEKVKEVAYDPTGMPVEEWIQLSPSRYSISQWYDQGTPMRVEEYAGEELLEGQYFSRTNDIESRIEKGAGLRIRRERDGTLAARELFEQGYLLKKETFYPNGTPETIAFYHRNHLHGEKRTFAANGEPLSIEEWVGGQLHGKSNYFKNGNRYLEISYLNGEKNGVERHYIDADIISQEITWENDHKHGPSTYYIDGQAEKHWFYNGQSVNKRKFDDLSRFDEMVYNRNQMFNENENR